ncbi:MAG: ATP-grasp domain-containing protein [Promethearchaeia archaeon]
MQSVLVVGFNIRPLAYSLNKAGYQVYAVDFFGDLDLFPYVHDAKIVLDELQTEYEFVKDEYVKFLAKFAIDMLKEHNNIDFVIIGSGLDDDFREREMIQDYIEQNHCAISLNNDIQTLKKARDIWYIYDLLGKKGYKFPKTFPFDQKHIGSSIDFPFIVKKAQSSGGLNITKCVNQKNVDFLFRMQNTKELAPSDYLIQEYIEGIPLSCTVISDGENVHSISINRQILGEKILNPPKEFIYCGNIVPGNVLRKDRERIIEISKYLAIQLKLKGIIGFDYVLSKHNPYLMEINPRIPGSIRASEKALGINLLECHIRSFHSEEWEDILQKLEAREVDCFATKLILFAPQKIGPKKIGQINKHPFVHDKTPPNKVIKKGEPVCTILYAEKTFAGSYFDSLKIANKLNQIIKEPEI